MFLLVFTSLRVLVLENKVNLTHVNTSFAAKLTHAYLVGSTALVGAKHNHIWGGVGELLGVKLLVVLKKLHVRATTVQVI